MVHIKVNRRSIPTKCFKQKLRVVAKLGWHLTEAPSYLIKRWPVKPFENVTATKDMCE